MKMFVPAVIAVAVATVASAAAIAYSARDASPQALETHMSTTPIVARESNAEIVQLATELAILRRELGARTESKPQPPTDEHTATVAADFRNEPLDPPFAVTTADSLRGVLDSDELAKMPVQTIDCRTKTCRIEIGDDGSGIVPRTLPMFMVRMADTLPNVIAQRLEQPNGRATMVLYMSK